MSDIFLHGIQNVTVDDGARPITTVRSSTIGLIGSAPEADPLIFPLNKPVLIAGSRTLAAKLGETGTLPQAEPYRVCRRLNILRDYPDDKIKIYPRN